jgi:hypothetical protein
MILSGSAVYLQIQAQQSPPVLNLSLSIEPRAEVFGFLYELGTSRDLFTYLCRESA